MSFYGSVYYQLIDTFYKVVLRNKGIENTEFLNNEKNPAEWLESQAVGRKGVFGFDTGNRWINLNTYSETDDDNNEQRSIFEIYHGAPDPEANNTFNGFKAHLSNEDLEDRLINGIIHLDYGDEFETYETKYDDAGHISEAVKKTYKLPKNKEDERLDTLEKLVGTDDKRNLPEVESDADKNLHGYVEKNTNDINTLLKYVGSWTDVAEPDNFSIAKVIGNLNNLLGTSYLGDSSFKSLSDIIGKMPDLWNGYDANLANAKYSLIQTILDLKKRYDNYTTLNDVSVGGNSNDIKIIQDSLSLDKRGELGTVYTEIINLYKALENLDIAYKQADTNLDGRLTGAENAINTINNTAFPLVDGRINTLDERVTAHEKAWAGSEAVLAKDIEDLNTNLNTLTKTVTDNYDELDKAIDDLEIKLSNNASTNKQELQGLVDGLRADLGTKTGEIDAFTAIEANAAGILTINNKIGTVSEDRPLSVQVNDNLNSINNLNATSLTKEEASNTYVSKTALTEANYAKMSDLDNYITEEELAGKGYALDSTVSDISDRVRVTEEALTALGVSEEFTETEVPANTTILRAIFDQLADLNSKLTIAQNDITAVKNKMNELHSDNPPFPDNEEVIPPEEEEIPTE